MRKYVSEFNKYYPQRLDEPLQFDAFAAHQQSSFFSQAQLNELQSTAEHICREAGQLLLRIYEEQTPLDIEYKLDNSPLTLADRAVDEFLLTNFHEKTGFPVITEETQPAASERSTWKTTWLVDPLDGTQNFINRDGEFCIAAALVVEHQPLIGVLEVPCAQLQYSAAHSQGAVKHYGGQAVPILHSYPERPLQIVDSKLPSRNGSTLSAAFCLRSGVAPDNISRIGSAFKLGLLAEGVFDIAVRFDPMSEWDIAAADCILREAGCYLVDLADNELVTYNRRSTLQMKGFLAARRDVAFCIEQ